MRWHQSPCVEGRFPNWTRTTVMVDQSSGSHDTHQSGWGDPYDRGMSPWSQLADAIPVERTFADFEEYWATSTITPSVRPPLDAMTAVDRDKLKARVRALVPADATGRSSRPSFR
jgi:hypothetical protein